ncbi:flagellar hook-length control protein FliK [Desulfovulcanus sp.]
MQFFPLVSAQDQFLPVIDGQASSKQGGGSQFEELFSSLVSSAHGEEKASEDFTLKEGCVSGFQNRNAKAGQEVYRPLNEEEFSSLKKVLNEFGVKKEKIIALEKKFQKEGLKWKDVFSLLGLNSLLLKPLMDSDTQKGLQAAFQKLGFAPDRAKELIGQLKQNKKMLVWKEIKEQLEKLPADRKITFTENEIKSLQKGFGLKETDDIWKNFAQRELSLNDLKNLLALLKKETSQAELSGEFEREAILGSEKQAGLFDTILSLAQKGKAGDRNKKGSKSWLKTHKDEMEYRVAQNPQNSKGRIESRRTGEKDLKNKGSFSETDEKEDRWVEEKGHIIKGKKAKGILKTEEKGQAVKPGRDGKGDFRELSGLESVTGFEKVEQVVFSPGREKISRQVMAQLENGIFRNLGQGVKELKLQLSPPDLGRLNIVLQVKNNELTALIKTTNQDVTRIIADNMHQLRDALEKQGVQVNKLEVQTQLPDGQMGTPWQGTEKHNQAREHFRQSINLARLRGLTQDVEDNLVHDMQNIEHRENISLSGIDIFA